MIHPAAVLDTRNLKCVGFSLSSPSSEGGCCCGGERGARLGADSGEEAYGEPGASILPSCVGAARGRGAGAVAEAEEEADAGNSS